MGKGDQTASLERYMGFPINLGPNVTQEKTEDLIGRCADSSISSACMRENSPDFKVTDSRSLNLVFCDVF